MSEQPLTTRQTRHLRSLAHPLKVAVTVGGNGLTDAVRNEVDRALEHHELIKVKLPADSRERRRSLFDDLCRSTGATPIQQIGRVGIAWRRSRQPRIELP
jgi:RNA-binding protein